jgi:hypothetical protein
MDRAGLFICIEVQIGFAVHPASISLYIGALSGE